MRFGPGYVSFERLPRQYGGQKIIGWKITKLEFSWRKFRKGLKRARSFLLGIRRLQGSTIFRWMELSLRYSIACLGNVLSTTQHARLVSAMQILHVTVKRHRVKEAFSKGNGILMTFWSKLNDSDVKFKMYYKYGNARFEHKSGLSLRVTLHSQRLNLRTSKVKESYRYLWLCILKLLWSTLKDSAMKFKIYGMEMLSRVCG